MRLCVCICVSTKVNMYIYNKYMYIYNKYNKQVLFNLHL